MPRRQACFQISMLRYFIPTSPNLDPGMRCWICLFTFRILQLSARLTWDCAIVFILTPSLKSDWGAVLRKSHSGWKIRWVFHAVRGCGVWKRCGNHRDLEDCASVVPESVVSGIRRSIWQDLEFIRPTKNGIPTSGSLTLCEIRKTGLPSAFC